MLDEDVLILSARSCRKVHHVSYDTVLGMENSFVKAGANLKLFSKNIDFLNKVLHKLKIKYRMFDYKICKELKDKNVFFIAMGVDDLVQYKRELNFIARNNTLGIYCFDVWESKYDQYKKLFDFICPKLIFFAYKEAWKYFKKDFNSFFIPQSMDSAYFFPRKCKKSRLFIQIGRRNEKIHNLILEYLKQNNMTVTDENYLFEKQKGKILFPNTDDLATEIARSKYFIAAPQSCENTKLTGRVSDVTARFYEAMACKTMIIGYKPDTFDELFPKDAMIDLNGEEKTFDEVITFWEEHPEEYESVINRNYELVMEYHTWSKRYEFVKKGFEESICKID